MYMRKEDSIQKVARERAKQYWDRNPGMKTFKFEDLEKNVIQCRDCNRKKFKLYLKMGGFEIRKTPKAKKVMKYIPAKFNYVCECGTVLVLNEGEFTHLKLKYTCGAGKCPFGKEKMDKDCLSCQYIIEKD